MAVGDYLIRRNASDDTTEVTTSVTDLSWDTEAKVIGTGITYSSGEFTLVAAGVYLVIWNEYLEETSKTSDSSSREEIQGELQLDTGGGFNTITEGMCQGYIRRDSGQFQIVIKGTGIIRTSGANHKIKTIAYRTDDSTGEVLRTSGHGGVQIIRIDETDNFGRYASTAGQELTADTATDVVLGTSIEQDSPFTRTSNAIDISTTGRYLVSYSCDVSMTFNNRTEVQFWLELGGTRVPGSSHSVYLRSTDSTQDGAVSHLTLVDVGTANDDLVWRVARVEGGTVTTVASGACIQIWQLPSGNKTAIMEATGGTLYTNPFEWDTLPHIDTDTFTATAGNSNIDTDSAVSTYLVLASGARTTYGGCARCTPHYRVGGGALGVIPYGQDGSYFRGSGTAGFGGGGAACIIPDMPSGSIEMQNALLGTVSDSDTICQTGQLAVLDLGSLYTYVYPPVITDVEDELLGAAEADVLLDGLGFEATQGTGKLELSDNSVYATGTKVTQSIDSWSDDEIQFDVTIGALDEGALWLWVTTDGAELSNGYKVNVGLAPHDPAMALGADHWWTFDNVWTDSVAGSGWGAVTRGTPDFLARTISRTTTYAGRMNDGDDGTETPQSSYMNLGTHASRNVGGWVEVDSYQLLPAAIYEEGGGVNNLYFILGSGNILLCNAADSNNNWKAQTFSDTPLIPNRPYHILFDMQGTGGHGTIRMYIDGVIQASYTGSITSATMSSHSGDISIGKPGSSLDTGGTDISYKSVDTVYYSNWGSWSNTGGGAPLTATEIRDDLFRDGAIAKYAISSGTESAMQTAIEAYDDSTHVDWPLTYDIKGKTGGGDIELTLTDQVFPDEVSLQVRYQGDADLTIRNSGTSNLVASKVWAQTGGTVTIIETAQITVTVRDLSTGSVIQGARVYIEADAGGPLTEGDEILNTTTNASGIVTGEIDYTSAQPIVARVRSASGTPYYKTSPFVGSIGANGFDLTAYMLGD